MFYANLNLYCEMMVMATRPLSDTPVQFCIACREPLWYEPLFSYFWLRMQFRPVNCTAKSIYSQHTKSTLIIALVCHVQLVPSFVAI